MIPTAKIPVPVVDRVTSRSRRRLSRLVLAVWLLGAAVVVAMGAAEARAAATPSRNAKSRAKTKVTGKAKVAASAPASRVKRARKTRAPARAALTIPAGSKVAVFPFKGDDDQTVHAPVVMLLGTRGLSVDTSLRPLDTAEQYREMAATLNIVAYVEGDVREEGERIRATIHLRSGASGRRVRSVTFSGDRRQVPVDVGNDLWAKVTPALGRACAAAEKPHRSRRGPLRIEAGTPIETTPATATAEGT